MNRSNQRIIFALCLILWIGIVGNGVAVPIQVITDIASLSGSDFELEFALFGAGAATAAVLLDNVIITDNSGSPIVNLAFDTDLDGFIEDPFNVPSTVGNVSGHLRLSEDPAAFSTIVFQDFSLTDVSSLIFEFEVFDFDMGFFDDTFEASLLDPVTLDPLLTLSPADRAFFKYETGAGSSFDANITDSKPIPEPNTFILFGIVILGVIGFRISRCRRE